MEFSQYLLPISRKHQTAEQCQESANCGELYIKPDVNWLDSGKLEHSTTVSSQCERLSYIWTWRLLYFNRWSNFEKRRGIVYPIPCNQKLLWKSALLLLIILRSRLYTIDYKWLSFYSQYCEDEQPIFIPSLFLWDEKKVHYVLLSIELWW